MRDIWLCRLDGERERAVAPLGLPDEVWNELYRPLADDPARPILRRLWRHQWGPEGDALLSPDEVRALARELATWRAGPVLPTASAAAATFFQAFAEHIARATERGLGLRFLAD